MKKRLNALVALWSRYERRVGLAGLVIGFLFDLWLAKRPDSIADNILLLSYLFISASIIILLNVQQRRARKRLPAPELRQAGVAEGLVAAEPLLMLLILQFCFGGLANNLLILYGKSGTFAGSLIFLALLLGMAIGNEFLRDRYALLRFNIGVYYMLLLTYSVIAVPTFILHYIGTQAFLISGLISLLVMAAYLAILRVSVFRDDRRPTLEAGGIVAAIFLLFLGAYVVQIIPPVPLSLKDAGIYHRVVRSAPDAYAATYEPTPLLEFWRRTSAVFHAAPGESAVCFSAVFAPTGLSTPIYHRWEFYNPEAKQWVTSSRIAFPIYGGRAEGYRGYTILSAPREGAWRCSVETASGALIGRIEFTVVNAATTTLETTQL